MLGLLNPNLPLSLYIFVTPRRIGILSICRVAYSFGMKQENFRYLAGWLPSLFYQWINMLSHRIQVPTDDYPIGVFYMFRHC